MGKAENYDNLVAAVENQVRNNGLTEYRIQQYWIIWRGLRRYLQQCQCTEFTREIGEAYLNDYGLPRKKPPMSTYEKIRVRAIFILGDYLENGMIHIRRPSSNQICPPLYQEEQRKFLSYMKLTGLSQSSIQTYHSYTTGLFCWLSTHDLQVSETPNAEVLLGYLATNCVSSDQQAGYVHRYHVLQHYLKFLEDDREANVSKLNIIMHKPKTKKRLPSVYTENEITLMRDSIDIRTSIGKRDLAMFMLMSRLGIRASDIANLRFEYIDWERASIRFCQVKTAQDIDLPLMEDIGQALIDYLIHGRPASTSDYVFLSATPPIRPLLAHSIFNRFKRIIENSHVNENGTRNCGPHSLRHSLASNLLKHDVSMPVIQSILGHTNLNTTKKYICIDIESLRNCALPVLPPSGKFKTLLQEAES